MSYEDATTWFDRTNYYEIAHPDHLDTMLAIKSEQMTSASLTDEDLFTEREVVLSEFHIGQNNPYEALETNVWSTAYHAHPYNHSTIGWESDIKNITAQDLQKLYQRYYTPNNAALSIIGDFDEDTLPERIAHYFANIKNPTTPYEHKQAIEPQQEGRRHCEITRTTPENILMIAHKIPEGLHADIPALAVLDHILVGSKISRLHRALVDTGLATAVQSGTYIFHDNALMNHVITLTKKGTHAKVEKNVRAEYETLKNEGVSTKELQSAKMQLQNSFSSLVDGPYRLLSTLNESLAVGDWTFYHKLQEQIADVTKKDIQQVAREYLTEKTCTTGYFKEQ